MSDATTTDFERRTGGEHWVPYWAAGRARELRFQRCSACKALSITCDAASRPLWRRE